MKKTYAIYGLIDFKCEVQAGVMQIPVEFSGGHVSGYGITPAVFTTADPVLQRSIERTSLFTSGRIRLMK